MRHLDTREAAGRTGRRPPGCKRAGTRHTVKVLFAISTEILDNRIEFYYSIK